MSEREQALDGRELPRARGRREPGVRQRVGPRLEVVEREPLQRHVREVDEGADVAVVGVVGVGRLAVEPEPDEVLVVVGLGDRRGHGRRADGEHLRFGFL